MFGLRRDTLKIEAPRLVLRLPRLSDHIDWVRLRREGRDFIEPWEPAWSGDHFTRSAFRSRVSWSRQAARDGRALPLFLERREDGALLGAITLDHIRMGPAKSGTVGYWIGEPFARQGYMAEALDALVDHAFHRMSLSRIDAACLEENAASRALLARCGFEQVGRAPAYLEIAGRWRTHLLFARLREDRREG
ncbi:MAG: GNAT family N-acetyltransferase [Rubricella sp.]